MVLPQIVVQRGRTRFCQKGLEHHVLATAFGEARAVFFPQRAYLGITVLLVDFAAFVSMAAVKAAMPLCDSALLWIA